MITIEMQAPLAAHVQARVVEVLGEGARVVEMRGLARTNFDGQGHNILHDLVVHARAADGSFALWSGVAKVHPPSAVVTVDLFEGAYDIETVEEGNELFRRRWAHRCGFELPKAVTS